MKTLKDYFPMKRKDAKRVKRFERNYTIGSNDDKEKQQIDFIENRILLDKNPLERSAK